MLFKVLRRSTFKIILSIALLPVIVCAEAKPKIGVVLPLTGKAAAAGEALQNGIRMAMEHANSPLDIVFEDNGLDSVRSISAAHKLIERDQVLGLIVYASGPSHAVAPIAENANVPMLGMSLDLNVVKDRKWVMIFWSPAKRIGDALLAQIKQRDLHSIAVLTSQTQGVMELGSYFVSQVSEPPFSLVYNQQFLPSDIDFNTPIIQLRQRQPDVCFINLYYGQAGAFASQARTQGLKCQFISHFVLDNDSEIASSHGALDGAFFADTSNGDGSFEQEYTERFQKRPVLGAIQGYDIVSLYAQAVATQGVDRQRVNDALHSVNGFAGKIGNFSALNNGSFDIPAKVRWIVNGKVSNDPAQ